MVRSLTITPEDDVTTSPLLTGFLVLASLWLLMSHLSADASGLEEPLPALADTELMAV